MTRLSVLPILPDHFLPGVVRVGGADDDLQLGIHLPDAADRLDAIPAGRHAHIDEGHGVGPPFLERPLHHLQPFLALEGGVDLELDVGSAARLDAEERRGLGVERGVFLRRRRRGSCGRPRESPRCRR